MKEFKVWISIEEIDEEHDVWENIGEPESLATFDTLEEAEAFLNDVYDKHYDIKKDPYRKNEGDRQ